MLLHWHARVSDTGKEFIMLEMTILITVGCVAAMFVLATIAMCIMVFESM